MRRSEPAASRDSSGKRRRAAQNAAQTRRFYAFEGQLLDDPNLSASCRIGTLRRIAERLWSQQCPRAEKLPQIVTGAGYFQGGRYLSYCEGRRRIMLARHERNRLVLLHELVHALGFTTHGPRFQRKYTEILTKYGGTMRRSTRAQLDG